jgi:hypothetical protein
VKAKEFQQSVILIQSKYIWYDGTNTKFEFEGDYNLRDEFEFEQNYIWW